MKFNRFSLLTAAFGIFFAGSAYYLYSDRPVMKLASSSQLAAASNSPGQSTNTNSGNATVTEKPANSQGAYSLADIQTHNTQSDCWSAINSSVYDLTSWVDRHPGGSEAIISLCGSDGSIAYNGMHGGARRPQSILALLKIGELKK